MWTVTVTPVIPLLPCDVAITWPVPAAPPLALNCVPASAPMRLPTSSSAKVASASGCILPSEKWPIAVYAMGALPLPLSMAMVASAGCTSMLISVAPPLPGGLPRPVEGPHPASAIERNTSTRVMEL